MEILESNTGRTFRNAVRKNFKTPLENMKHFFTSENLPILIQIFIQVFVIFSYQKISF